VSRFIEVSDDRGLVTVFHVAEDGYAQIHVSLLKEFIQAGGYTFEEGAE
jgi:hypothetical protein